LQKLLFLPLNKILQHKITVAETLAQIMVLFISLGSALLLPVSVLVIYLPKVNVVLSQESHLFQVQISDLKKSQKNMWWS